MTRWVQIDVDWDDESDDERVTQFIEAKCDEIMAQLVEMGVTDPSVTGRLGALQRIDE